MESPLALFEDEPQRVSDLTASHEAPLRRIAHLLSTAVEDVHPQVTGLPAVRSSEGGYIKATFAQHMALPGRLKEFADEGVTVILDGPAETWLRLRFDHTGPLVRVVMRPTFMPPAGQTSTQSSLFATGELWMFWEPRIDGHGLESLTLALVGNARSAWFHDGVEVLEEATIVTTAVTAAIRREAIDKSLADFMARRPSADNEAAPNEPVANEETEETQEMESDEGAEGYARDA